jgi:hypothetical protein
VVPTLQLNLEKMSDSFSNFLAQAAAYVVEHKMWFMVGGGVLVGAVVLGLIIAAAAGAFAPAQTLVPVPEFDIVSITDSAGAADTNASVIGTYAQIEVSAYAGPQVAGEQIVAAWLHGTEKYVTYAKVTATGKYVTHVQTAAGARVSGEWRARIAKVAGRSGASMATGVLAHPPSGSAAAESPASKAARVTMRWTDGARVISRPEVPSRSTVSAVPRA